MHLLIVAGFLITQWSGPVNLGITGIDDMNPQTCRAQLWESPTCLVWQANIGGDWEIFSRIVHGNWSDTSRIPTGPGADIYPCVAYDTLRTRFWCAWQRYVDNNYEIYVSFRTSYGSWTTPIRLTNDTNIDASPSICIIGNNVWIAWRKNNNIYSCYYNGTSWSSPIPVTNDPIQVMNDNPKINNRHNNPFVVWVRNRDIYYSEHINNTWQTPQAIAPHSANDTLPEIAKEAHPYAPTDFKVWVFWQSNRDGNFEIYRTGYDSMNVFYRVTNNNSNDITPNPLDFVLPIRQFTQIPSLVAFSTDRNGTYDIYSLRNYWTGSYDTIPVDINPAQDISPVTTMVMGYPNFLWVFWETNRNGDWDIYGSYILSYGNVEESFTYQGDNLIRCLPNPVINICQIRYNLTAQERVKLAVYAVNGELVREIADEIQSPGDHYIKIKTDFFNNGVYFIKLETEKYSAVEKLVVVK